MRNIGAAWRLDYSIQGRCFSDKDVTAHTGIIPQEVEVDVASLTEVERKVYEAIVLRYALQFLPDAEADISLTAIEGPEGRLEHRAKRWCRQGWRELDKGHEKPEELQEGFLEAGAHCYVIIGHEVRSKKTKSRPPYTEGTLVKDMSAIAKYVNDPDVKRILIEKDKGKKGEHGGIGTPATRTAIIERLKEKGYLQVIKGKIVSTTLGRRVYHACPDDIKGADLTARWWLMCEDVRAGRLDEYAVAESVCEAFLSHRDTAYEGVRISREDTWTNVGTCPLCGKPVVDKGAKSKVYTCSSNRGHWEKTDAGERWVQDSGCGFSINKQVARKRLTKEQVGSLLRHGSTAVIRGFTSKSGGKFSARLVLDTTRPGNIRFEFPKGR